MTRTFRFPIPRDERMVMLVAALIGPGVVAVVLMLLADLAASNDRTLGQMFEASQGLRAAFAAMLLVYLFGLFAMWSFFVVKNGATLEVGDLVRYRCPGVPLLGWLQRDVTLDAESLDRISVGRVRRGVVERIELVIGAGREEIAVNLGHAIEPSEPSSRQRPDAPRSEWAELPLVAALRAASGRDVLLG